MALGIGLIGAGGKPLGKAAVTFGDAGVGAGGKPLGKAAATFGDAGVGAGSSVKTVAPA